MLTVKDVINTLSHLSPDTPIAILYFTPADVGEYVDGTRPQPSDYDAALIIQTMEDNQDAGRGFGYSDMENAYEQVMGDVWNDDDG